MPAPYAKKHFLEMSNREYEAYKEEQRRKDMERPGRDAIQSDFPEANLLLPLRGAKAAIQSAVASRAASRKTTEESIRGIPMPPNKMLQEEDLVMKSLPAKELKKIKEEANRRALEESRKQYKEDAKRKFVKDIGESANRSSVVSGAQITANELDRSTAYNKGGAVKKGKVMPATKMKMCEGCPSPAACKKAGKCLMKDKANKPQRGAKGMAVLIAVGMPKKKGR